MKTTSISPKVTTLFLFGAILLFMENAEARRDIPDDNLVYPAIIIIDNRLTGSGFYRRRAEDYYFVTARHVLFEPAFVNMKESPKGVSIPENLRHKLLYIENEKEKRLIFYGSMSIHEKNLLLKISGNDRAFGSAIETLFQRSQQPVLRGKVAALMSYPKDINEPAVNELRLQLEVLQKANKILYHPSFDVAALKIGKTNTEEGQRVITFEREVTVIKVSKSGTVSLPDKNIKLFNDVLVGNAVFVFGYPTSLASNPYIDIKRPLLRKGIIAGKNETLKAIIIDCPVNKGNSGGLVIEAEHIGIGQTQYRAIGIVSAFVPFVKGKGQFEYENSGYSVVVPMDALDALLSK